MSRCDYVPPDDEEDNSDLAVKSMVQMGWDDVQVWQTPAGPHWFNAAGEKPEGLPVHGARVVIPGSKLNPHLSDWISNVH